MKLTIQSPRGRQPMLDPRLLDDKHGQVARNLYMRRGTLAPINWQLSLDDQHGVGNVSWPTTLYRYPYGNEGNGYWFIWGNSKRVSVVKSPLADDQYGRVYWTGDGAPKMGAIDQALGITTYRGVASGSVVDIPADALANYGSDVTIDRPQLAPVDSFGVWSSGGQQTLDYQSLSNRPTLGTAASADADSVVQCR